MRKNKLALFLTAGMISMMLCACSQTSKTTVPASAKEQGGGLIEDDDPFLPEESSESISESYELQEADSESFEIEEMTLEEDTKS